MNNLPGGWWNDLINQVRAGRGDSDRHLLTLFGLALGRRGHKYLELGVRDGATTLPLLLAAWLTPECLLYSVDTDLHYEPPAFLREAWLPHEEEALSYLEAAARNHLEPFDLVYVDDDHDGAHVRQELALLDKLVSPRSLILLHDTMYGQAPCYHSDPHAGPPWANGGPYGALVGLDTNLWEWSTVPYGHGLTLLRKKYSTLYHSLEDEA